MTTEQYASSVVSRLAPEKMFALKRAQLLAAVAGRWSRGARSFLSDAYGCDETWRERLDCALLKRVKHDELYHKLSAMLDGDRKQVHAVDLDVFANSLTDATYLDELEHLVHKFRLSAQSGTLLPSTHHAVIRFYLASGNRDDLMRILKDRLNYGIFPDYYLCNLLMDAFVKENNYRDAAVIASNQMLQEELDNDITRAMGLYVCLRYVSDPVEWEKTEESAEEKRDGKDDDDDDEERRVRVDFLRNPYFDDHFDITDGEHLVGKTMIAISKTDGSVMSNSVKAVGLAYYNRWDELCGYLDKLDGPVLAETVDLAVAAIDKRAPEKGEKLKDMLAKLTVENKSLTEQSKNAVNEAVNKNEEKEIQFQKKVRKSM